MKIAILAAILCAGCSFTDPPSMSPADIAKAKKECEDAGMYAKVERTMDGEARSVYCVPKDGEAQ